jgi:hypothetical protein
MVHAHRLVSMRLSLRLLLTSGGLMVALLSANTIHAQEVSPDFPGRIQTTLPSNEQLLGQILDTLPSDDLNLIAGETGVTVDVGEDLVQQLHLALSVAPDDAARSRVEGVLTHTQAALSSLRLAQTEATLESARGRLDEARGEALEGLDELRPFVLGLVTSGEITGK